MMRHAIIQDESGDIGEIVLIMPTKEFRRLRAAVDEANERRPATFGGYMGTAPGRRSGRYQALAEQLAKVKA